MERLLLLQSEVSSEEPFQLFCPKSSVSRKGQQPKRDFLTLPVGKLCEEQRGMTMVKKNLMFYLSPPEEVGVAVASRNKLPFPEQPEPLLTGEGACFCLEGLGP